MGGLSLKWHYRHKIHSESFHLYTNMCDHTHKDSKRRLLRTVMFKATMRNLLQPRKCGHK